MPPAARRQLRSSNVNDYLREQLVVDSQMRQVLELAARQSSARINQLRLTKGDGIGARVRVDQLSAVLVMLGGIQQDTWVNKIQGIIQRALPRAERAAAGSLSVVEAVLERAVGERRAASLIESFRRSVQQGLQLDRTRRAQALSPRVYRNAALSRGAVERMIRAGIIQGLSARELAADVRQYISPSTPGGVSYAAMRLARTELNNAFHEAQKEIGEAPWIRAVKWNLSATHRTRVRGGRDKCDELAEQDIYEYGPGRYPADRIPDKPHPHCLCFITYESVSESEMLDMIPSLLGRKIS